MDDGSPSTQSSNGAREERVMLAILLVFLLIMLVLMVLCVIIVKRDRTPRKVRSRHVDL